MQTVDVNGVCLGGSHPLALIAGPCQLETLDHARMMAERIAEACAPSGYVVIVDDEESLDQVSHVASSVGNDFL